MQKPGFVFREDFRFDFFVLLFGAFESHFVRWIDKRTNYKNLTSGFNLFFHLIISFFSVESSDQFGNDFFSTDWHFGDSRYL